MVEANNIAVKDEIVEYWPLGKPTYGHGCRPNGPILDATIQSGNSGTYISMDARKTESDEQFIARVESFIKTANSANGATICAGCNGTGKVECEQCSGEGYNTDADIRTRQLDDIDDYVNQLRSNG